MFVHDPNCLAKLGIMEVRVWLGAVKVKKIRIHSLTGSKMLLPRNIHGLMMSLLPLKPALLSVTYPLGI